MFVTYCCETFHWWKLGSEHLHDSWIETAIWPGIYHVLWQWHLPAEPLLYNSLQTTVVCHAGTMCYLLPDLWNILGGPLANKDTRTGQWPGRIRLCQPWFTMWEIKKHLHGIRNKEWKVNPRIVSKINYQHNPTLWNFMWKLRTEIYKYRR